MSSLAEQFTELNGDDVEKLFSIMDASTLPKTEEFNGYPVFTFYDGSYIMFHRNNKNLYTIGYV